MKYGADNLRLTMTPDIEKVLGSIHIDWIFPQSFPLLSKTDIPIKCWPDQYLPKALF